MEHQRTLIEPAKRQFQIYDKLGPEQPAYVPDFVAELADALWMVETKARDELSSAEVQAKAAAAVRWCAHASAYSGPIGSKPWRYLVVPHDAVTESVHLSDLRRFKPTTSRASNAAA